MGKVDLEGIHGRFDELSQAIYESNKTLSESIFKVDKTVTKLEEHQRSINGSIVRLQEEVNGKEKAIEENTTFRIQASTRRNVVHWLMTAGIGALITIVTIFGIGLQYVPKV